MSDKYPEDPEDIMVDNICDMMRGNWGKLVPYFKRRYEEALHDYPDSPGILSHWRDWYLRAVFLGAEAEIEHSVTGGVSDSIVYIITNVNDITTEELTPYVDKGIDVLWEAGYKDGFFECFVKHHPASQAA